MKLPDIQDFISDSFYLNRNHPKWSVLRSYTSPQLIFGLPLFFYFFLYPPTLACIWIFSTFLSGFIAKIPFITGLSRFSDLSTYQEISSAIHTGVMDFALLPVTIPLSIISPSILTTVLGLFAYAVSITAIFYLAFLVVKIVFGIYKLLWRMIL